MGQLFSKVPGDDTVNSDKIVDDSIMNADINSAAGIEASKLEDGTKGDILASDGSGFNKIAKGADTHVLTADSGEASGVKWAATPVGISDVVDDTTPQLGGDLDINGNSLVSTSDGDIPITPNGTGDVVLDGLKWPQADGTADQILKTDGSAQLAWTDAGGGGALQPTPNDNYLPTSTSSYHTLQVFTTASVLTTATDAGKLNFFAIVVANDINVTQLGINVSTAQASSNTRFAIYQDNDGDIGTRIFESGNIDTSTTGWKFVASTQTITAGVYWIAFTGDTDGVQLRACDFALGVGLAVGGTSTVVQGLEIAFTYAEIPSSYTFVGKSRDLHTDEPFVIFFQL